MAFRFECIVAGTLSAVAAVTLSDRPLPAQASSDSKPVLVELFTSEGCSDCPPADDLIARLDRDQPIPGVHAIVLSEHVTYWNHQGWTDPFSMEQFDYRQKDYQAHFKLDDVYTPQMVIDGEEQLVGSDAGKAGAAIAHAASESKQTLSVAAAAWEKKGVRFSVQTPASQGVHLFAAIAEDVTHSEVSRGENAGRTLHHVAVVRALKEFRAGFTDTPLSISASEVKKDVSSVRLIVFLADSHDGHVTAAAEKTLQRP